jgi:O-antigen ligase
VLFATYTLANKIEANYLDLFSKTIIFFYLFDLFILGWIKYYSPFSQFDVDPSIGGAGDSRVFHAKIVYLFILPFLYYYARYIEERKSKFLALSIIISLILLFQNHRSIWVSGSIALLSLIYLYKKFVTLSRFFNRGIIISITAISIIIFGGIFFTDTFIFEERASDIINWQTQGTGLWRYKQVEAYLPFIYNNIIWGLRFGGFELPILGPGSGFFQSATGHHFHNGFIDIIFYHGLIGLFLVYGILIFILYKLYKKKNKDLTDVVSFSFLLGAIAFSFSYQLPLAFWGIVGVIASFTSIDNIRNGINRKEISIAANKNVYKKHI